MIDLKQSMTSNRVEKEALLKEMIAFFFADAPQDFRDTVLTKCLQREAEASTMVDKGIAFPHAVLQEEMAPQVLCCFASAGVSWNSAGDKVSVVILLVCNAPDHLPTLAELASTLQMPGVRDKLVKVGSAEEMTDLLLKTQEQQEKTQSGGKELITQGLLQEITRLAQDLEHMRIVLFSNSYIQIFAMAEQFKGQDLILVSSKQGVLERSRVLKSSRCILYPVQGYLSHQKEILKQMWTDKVLADGDVTICLSGFEFDVMAHNITIAYIPRDLYDEARVLNYRIPHNINLEILSRVISLASELASQGREGKPVGTIFVVGDYDAVKDYCKQLIINPFGGLDEHECSILDSGLSETIKEFSKIDGAYIIDNSGKIHSSGTYLSIPPHSTQLHPGLGARHAAALGVTLVAPVVSVVISESTGDIRVFWDGIEQDTFTPTR